LQNGHDVSVVICTKTRPHFHTARVSLSLRANANTASRTSGFGSVSEGGASAGGRRVRESSKKRAAKCAVSALGARLHVPFLSWFIAEPAPCFDSSELYAYESIRLTSHSFRIGHPKVCDVRYVCRLAMDYKVKRGPWRAPLIASLVFDRTSFHGCDFAGSRTSSASDIPSQTHAKVTCCAW
jgi:hypothetical protein